MRNFLLLFVAVLILCGCFPFFIGDGENEASREKGFALSSEEVLSEDE